MRVVMWQVPAGPEATGGLPWIGIAIGMGVIAGLLIVLLIVRRRRPPEEPMAWDLGERPSLFEPPHASSTPAAATAPGSRPEEEIDKGLRDSAQRPRIRGLLILNLPPDAGPEHIEGAPALGARDEVIAQLRRAIPGIEVAASGRAALDAPDHDLRIDLGPADPVATAVGAASGEAGIDLLQRLLAATGWRAYAPRVGSFVDGDRLHQAAAPAPGDR